MLAKKIRRPILYDMKKDGKRESHGKSTKSQIKNRLKSQPPPKTKPI